jgi:hypothetical protein
LAPPKVFGQFLHNQVSLIIPIICNRVNPKATNQKKYGLIPFFTLLVPLLFNEPKSENKLLPAVQSAGAEKIPQLRSPQQQRR